MGSVRSVTVWMKEMVVIGRPGAISPRCVSDPEIRERLGRVFGGQFA